jgi:hypothetical protein
VKRRVCSPAVIEGSILGVSGEKKLLIAILFEETAALDSVSENFNRRGV